MEYKITNGSITIDGTTILEEINFEINTNDKIAIIGRNGSGKTTLLKSLIDNNLLEKGIGEENLKIIKTGNPTIGYLEQHAFTNLDITLIEEILKVYSPITKLKNKIQKLEKELSTNPSNKVVEDYTKYLEQYKLIGGYTYQKELTLALHKFGFNDIDKTKKLSEFSGGQRTKIAFLKLLLSKPDILLLDEPTNHLDITTVEWLEKYLSDYKKALVVVSHDRMFLDKVVNKVYEIEYGNLTKYKGNYTSFEKQKRMNYERQLKDYDYQQKEIKRLTDIANRFRFKPSKASMAMSKLKKIEQMKIIDSPQKYDTKVFNTNLKINTNNSNNVLSVRELCIGYNNNPLATISFELYKGERIAIIGENGKGKSTLLKTLVGLIPKISGKYTYGYNIEKEYFDQQIKFLNEENTIYEEYQQTFPTEEPLQIRKNLGTFLFTGEDVFKKINILSGGEKVRLELCKIFKHNPNLLLLDEPTNHLDILGRETLENILENYPGTILFVSHDRYFINKIATSLLIFEQSKVTPFNGKYNEYILNPQKEPQSPKKSNPHPKPLSKKKPTNHPNNQLKKLEKEIQTKEINKKEIETLMLEENIYNDYKKMNELQTKLTTIDAELENLMSEWISLNE